MPDFTQSMQAPADLPEAQQVQMGKSVAAKMGDKHDQFLKNILALLERKEINVLQPESFLKKEAYDALPETERNRVDASLINIANLLSHIVEFRVSRHTPDESPELQSMIESLWQMKQRIEEKHDIFKF